MKFACLGYLDEKQWESMSESQQEAMIAECLAYDETLRSRGNWGNGEALQGARTARTLRRRGGKIIVTDGPYAETNELLGGFFVLEARDVNHAVELMSKHPGVRLGPFEIRPIDEERGQRCQHATASPDSRAEGIRIICFAYGDEKNWSAMSPSEQAAMFDECAAYGEVVRRYGRWVGSEPLQGAATAKTLRTRGGRVLVTDGPYAETKEQLGGFAAYRFKNMEQAIEAWSNFPCLRIGDSLELRPADEEFMARAQARLAQVQSK